jgi:hypothetical protein
MYETTKTIYHTHLELQRAMQEDFNPLPYSTLNEKFGVADEETVPTGRYPAMEYIAIGRGGHRGRIASDGATLTDILQHDVTDAALFEHLPFVVRPVSEDLTPAERAKYGMRTLVERNGKQYFAYYLKRVNLSQTYPELKEITVLDGTVSDREYTPTPSQLTPNPLPLSNTQANLASGKHISVTSTLSLSLSATDIQEIMDAVLVLYDDVAYATISEIATVTAHRTPINTTLGGVNVTYDEAIAAQVANFIPANISLQFTTNGIDSLFSLGHTSPYLR